MALFRRTLALTQAVADGARAPLVAGVAVGAAEREGGPNFGVSIDPGTLYGVQSLDDAVQWTLGVRRVTRREAICAPAVKRARDLIAGGLGQLPLKTYDPAGQPTTQFSPSIIDQPEDGVPSVVTWTNVVDDLMFSSRSWLAIQARGWHNRPATCVRLDPDSVSVQPTTRTIRTQHGTGTALEWPNDPLLIRIDSPNDALLVAGARAIRTLGLLEAAGLRSVDGAPPIDYFSPAEGADPMEDDEIVELLDAWKAARQTRSTAYVPAALKYNFNGWSPEQLQLNGAREIAICEIARLTGIDTEDLGVSTTSRTYANTQDRRKAFLDFTLGPYMRAIEARLSMDDVTPHGYTVRFDTSDFLRADDKTAADTDVALVSAGIVLKDEVRARRGLEPLPAEAPTPQQTPQDQETPA